MKKLMTVLILLSLFSALFFVSLVHADGSDTSNTKCASEGQNVYDMESKGPIVCCGGLTLKKCEGTCTPSILGTCEKFLSTECVCIDVYNPVCGSDGKTYSNGCVAKCTGVGYKEGKCGVECPVYTTQPLPPCKDGEVYVSGGYDDQGCFLPGKCVPNTGSIKIVVVDENSKISACSLTNNKIACGQILNAKVSVYDSYSNLVDSKDTSTGAAVFYNLKEGKYTASASAQGYNPSKKEFKIIGGDSDYLTIYLESETGTTPTNDTGTTPIYYRNAYWQCYDGYEEKSGGETSCKPVEVWKKYAQESCEKRCRALPCNLKDKACLAGVCNLKDEACLKLAKCGVNSFSVYNECPSDIIETPVCGNGICESGEGEACTVSLPICKENVCIATKTKCKVVCPQDCNNLPGIYANLDEKFKLEVNQEVKINNYNENKDTLKIKFNNLFAIATSCGVVSSAATGGGSSPTTSTTTETKSAVIEKYNSLTGKVISDDNTAVSPQACQTPICKDGSDPYDTGKVDSNGCKIYACSLPTACSTPICKDGSDPYDTGKVDSNGCKIYACPTTCDGKGEIYAVLQIKVYDINNKEKTEVIKLKFGEKKKVFDVIISFLDYDTGSNMGVFVVSLDQGTSPQCPENCICDLSGNIMECKKIIETCSEKQTLCSDGVCREKCEITNVTTDCKFGCFYSDKCLPYGLRISSLYCSIDNNMKSQLQADEKCDNSFECDSNLCIDGTCISKGFFKKLIEWFSSIFGGK